MVKILPRGRSGPPGLCLVGKAAWGRGEGGSWAGFHGVSRPGFLRGLHLVAFLSAFLLGPGKWSWEEVAATFTSSAYVLGGSLYFCPDSAQVGLQRRLGFHLPKPRGERSGLGLPVDLFLMAPSAFACKSK